MKDVLDEGLIVTLVALQPRKETVAKNYVVPSPVMAGCGSLCSGTCKNACLHSCKGGGKSGKRGPKKH